MSGKAEDAAKGVERGPSGGDPGPDRPAGTHPRRWNRFRNAIPGLAEGILNHYIAVSGLLTLIAGGFYGLAYARFYHPLGITPEEAGLSTAQIVAHSVIGGLALVALISAGIFLLFVPLVPIKSDEESRLEEGTWEAFAENCLVTAMAVGALAGLAWATGVDVFAFVVFALWPVLWLLTGLKRSPQGAKLPFAPKPLEFSWELYVAYAVAFAIPLGLFATGAVTFYTAKDLGNKVSDGQAVGDSDVVGLSFLGVRAEPALISFKPGSEVPSVPHCTLYLGSSNGQVVLYDHRSGSTIEVPSNDVVLRLREDQTSCEAPANLQPPGVKRLNVSHYRCTPGEWHSNSQMKFTYRWTAEGEPLSDYYGGTSPVLDAAGLESGRIVYCHVTASTPVGDNSAVSRAVVLSATAPHAEERPKVR